MDAYETVVAANKSYVIKGESYTAEIFLGAYSSTTDNLSISVDGRDYPVRNGKAVVRFNPNEIGARNHRAKIRVTDPISGEVKTYEKDFAFEVGERSVAVSLDKMNVFYVGVDNPISISAAGVPSDQVRVSAEGVPLNKSGNGKYTVRPERPGRASLTVSGGGLPATTFDYLVKPIPTPVIKLGNKTGGSMSANEIKVYERLSPVLENFDFTARCNIKGFELARQPKNDDVKFATNPGGDFKGDAKRIINQARRGDTFYFDKIKVRCPGDEYNREVPGLIFRIR
ncbi:MAG: GldM family protein [Bacteroidota bacterium]